MDLDAIQIAGTQITAVQKNFSLPTEAATIYRKAAVIQRTNSPITIDGSLADWGLIEPLRLDQAYRHHYGYQRMGWAAGFQR